MRECYHLRTIRITIEPIREDNIGGLADLFFRSFRKLDNPRIVGEYIRRIIQTRSHLCSYVIKRNEELVGSSCLVKVCKGVGLVLFTVADEGFAGPERLHAFGKAYRQTIKKLVAAGIAKTQSQASKDNTAAMSYFRATGNILFVEYGGQAHFENYSPLIAASISRLSDARLEDISLLKLAAIAGNPNRIDDWSYLFDFEFRRQRYVLEIDKLSNGLHSVSFAEFSARIICDPSGWTNEPLKASLAILNTTDHEKGFKVVLRVNVRGTSKTLLRKEQILKAGSGVTYPLTLDRPQEGIIALQADITSDARRLTLTKAVAVTRPLRFHVDISRSFAKDIGLDISNTADSKLDLTVTVPKANGKGLERNVSVRGGAQESLSIPFNPDTKSFRLGIGHAGNGQKFLSSMKMSRVPNGYLFNEDWRYKYTNKNLVISIDLFTGTLAFSEATDGKAVIYQLPEEVGPPFTEWEYTEFRRMPVSHRVMNPFSGPYSTWSADLRCSPRVRISGDGIVVMYRLPGHRKILVEKELCFKNDRRIEVKPRITNMSDIPARGKIIVRSCLKIVGNTETVLSLPLEGRSMPKKSRITNDSSAGDLSYLDGMLKKRTGLSENWTAIEFGGIEKCVWHVWQGNPEPDFFPTWFNKMPWLGYRLNLRPGQSKMLPSHSFVFGNREWQSVSTGMRKS